VSLPPSNTLPGAHALQGSEHEAWIGRTLAGKYRIERVLGQGGMGTVFEAENLELQGKVAVKVLSAAPSENRTKRFVQEAKAAARIGHPGVVQVFDIGEDHGMPFLVMERISGVSLATRLEHGRLELHVALSLMDQLLEVLGAAHEAGVIHRDVKPANIMILEGSGERLKLLDFGIAKLRERVHEPQPTKLTQTGAMMGTPWYMSPEQILQDETADHRADLWSATATFFEMLTGARVHGDIGAFAALVRVATEPAPKLRTKLRSASKSLEVVVAKALELEREKRYPTASALRAAIALASEGRSETKNAFSKRTFVTVLLALAGGVAGFAFVESKRATTLSPGAARSTLEAPALRSLRENQKAPPVPLASADSSARTVVAVPGVRCTGSQTVSKGHCCPRGLEWIGKQCDRPLAEKLGP
jgi:eukaryotic-like serine/threonine-protein kinase